MSELFKELIKICRQDEFDLATAGLIASGVGERARLEEYLERFNGLCLRISEDGKYTAVSDNVERAQAVSDWLWDSKPDRAEHEREGEQGTFELTDVLDNQLSESKVVGNCYGLTLLYNSVAQRLEIVARAVFDEKHVYSVIEGENGWVRVENTVDENIGSRPITGRIISDKELIKGVLAKVGDSYERKGDYRKSFESKKTMFLIDPEGEPESYLRTLAAKLGDLDMAVSAYEEILHLHPKAHNIMRGLGFTLGHRSKPGDRTRELSLYEAASRLSPDPLYDLYLKILR